MASDLSFVKYVCDQIGARGRVSLRKMFGEYAVYLDGKVLALVCDNQCLVKPTAAGREFLGAVTEAPPYPGAKPHFLIAEQLDDRQLVSQLLRLTAAELPAPKPKTRKKQTR
jgi:TfoX/Sxy family transcriptional regulator of competence genes